MKSVLETGPFCWGVQFKRRMENKKKGMNATMNDTIGELEIIKFPALKKAGTAW